MRLSANRIRSINLRIAQSEGSAFAGFGRNARVLPNALKPTVTANPVYMSSGTTLVKATSA
jgi:hypothetical protein